MATDYTADFNKWMNEFINLFQDRLDDVNKDKLRILMDMAYNAGKLSVCKWHYINNGEVPKEDGYYLTARIMPDGYRFVDREMFNMSINSFMAYNACSAKVYAWAELPEAPVDNTNVSITSVSEKGNPVYQKGN